VGREAFAAFVVLAALVVRSHRLVLHGVFHLRGEIADEFYPLATSVFSQIRAGNLPTWTPEILLAPPPLRLDEAVRSFYFGAHTGVSKATPRCSPSWSRRR